jgi:hypothetical protein
MKHEIHAAVDSSLQSFPYPLTLLPNPLPIPFCTQLSHLDREIMLVIRSSLLVQTLAYLLHDTFSSISTYQYSTNS